jgi:hypothetical protein
MEQVSLDGWLKTVGALVSCSVGDTVVADAEAFEDGDNGVGAGVEGGTAEITVGLGGWVGSLKALTVGTLVDALGFIVGVSMEGEYVCIVVMVLIVCVVGESVCTGSKVGLGPNPMLMPHTSDVHPTLKSKLHP